MQTGGSAPISAIIPVYNGERYLAEAIGSVLVQDVPPLEIIVVDDGSTDASVRVAREFGPPVRVEAREHGGISAARNLGVSLATGDFLAFLDADDLWTEGRLALQMEAFAQDPELDMVFGHVVQFHSPDLDPALRNKITYAQQVMPGYLAGSLLVRRASFLRVGPFASAWRVGEFIDWYLRAQEMGLHSLMLPEVVLMRRLHAGNTVIRERDSRGDYVQILKAAMNRRRAARLHNEGE